jgi:carboxypeptidase D
LKGLLIGNGWIAPKEQSLAYLDFAYKSGLIEKGSDIAKQIEAQQSLCKAEFDSPGHESRVSYQPCEDILHKILKLTIKNDRCVNMYDVRLDDTYPSCGMNWPPDLKFITPYLRRPDVVSALHVNPDKKTGWTECSGSVGGAFKARHSKPSIELLPEILKTVPILLFSGDQDLICAHPGTESLIHNMEWNGGKGFETAPGVWAPRQDWTYEGEAAGYYQQARNLTYVLFYNASHMVPFDYPRRTRDMLDRFMGVDIASIGGKPTDSRINGEKSSQTSVGGHPNSTQAEQQVEQKIDAERWAAYYRSGSIALVVVAVLAVIFGWYVWQDRRRRAGYRGLAGNDSSRGLVSENPANRDVESSAAFDMRDNETDNLRSGREGAPRYSVGGLSDDEEDDDLQRKPYNGRASGR